MISAVGDVTCTSQVDAAVSTGVEITVTHDPDNQVSSHFGFYLFISSHSLKLIKLLRSIYK